MELTEFWRQAVTLRRVGIALYSFVAAAVLWAASLPWLLLLVRPTLGQMCLQLLAVAAASAATAWADSSALAAQEPVSLPKGISGPLLKLAGPWLHWQAAKAWGHAVSASCWRRHGVCASCSLLIGAMNSLLLAQGSRSQAGVVLALTSSAI